MVAEPHSFGAPGAIAAMGVGDDETATSEKAKLEVFDGKDPSLYRLWKRRAQLLLASLPSTISKEKYGPKLMSYIGGEAENLLESLEIEKICSDGGDKLIWTVLDEKYGQRQIDMMQENLKYFFYELAIKPQESYRQFSARFATGQRKLEELQVTLPNVVLGYLYLKKLKMESQSESMVLTATGGKLEVKEIIKAVNSIFPEGKGSSAKQLAAREVYQAETQDEDEDDNEEMQRAMEIMAEDIQARDEWSEEEILEAYEAYSDVRRKMREQRTSRGFYPKPSPD